MHGFTLFSYNNRRKVIFSSFSSLFSFLSTFSSSSFFCSNFNIRSKKVNILCLLEELFLCTKYTTKNEDILSPYYFSSFPRHSNLFFFCIKNICTTKNFNYLDKSNVNEVKKQKKINCLLFCTKNNDVFTTKFCKEEGSDEGANFGGKDCWRGRGRKNNERNEDYLDIKKSKKINKKEIKKQGVQQTDVHTNKKIKKKIEIMKQKKMNDQKKHLNKTMRKRK